MATSADSFVTYYCSKCLNYGEYDAHGYYCKSNDFLKYAASAKLNFAHSGDPRYAIDPAITYMSDYRITCPFYVDKAAYEQQQRAEQDKARQDAERVAREAREAQQAAEQEAQREAERAAQQTHEAQTADQDEEEPDAQTATTENSQQPQTKKPFWKR
ncbi:MAG TPA: hypothetical protein PKL83_06015 [bacterium]|nr:hypothetical protein [bacterium]